MDRAHFTGRGYGVTMAAEPRNMEDVLDDMDQARQDEERLRLRIETLRIAFSGPQRDEAFPVLAVRDNLREAGWVDKAYGYTILTIKGLEVAHYLGLTVAR